MATMGLSSQRDLAPYREYHARRSRERLERREARRRHCLDAARAGIRRLAPAFAPIRAVYLFGSLLQPGQFSGRSDVDVAIECDDIATEGRFRRALEEELRQPIDLRPLELLLEASRKRALAVLRQQHDRVPSGFESSFGLALGQPCGLAFDLALGQPCGPPVCQCVFPGDEYRALTVVSEAVEAEKVGAVEES